VTGSPELLLFRYVLFGYEATLLLAFSVSSTKWFAKPVSSLSIGLPQLAGEKKGFCMSTRSCDRAPRVSTRKFISVLFLLVALAAGLSAQEKKNSQTAGVDNTKMGPYRALAQLAYSASQKGENGTAAMLAKVLERTWDKAEDYGGDTALSKTNHALFENIDKAMDQFVTLLIDHPNSAPDPAKLKAAFGTYLEKLKLAD
jgi:hypothetical protein